MLSCVRGVLVRGVLVRGVLVRGVLVRGVHVRGIHVRGVLARARSLVLSCARSHTYTRMPVTGVGGRKLKKVCEGEKFFLSLKFQCIGN